MKPKNYPELTCLTYLAIMLAIKTGMILKHIIKPQRKLKPTKKLSQSISGYF